MMVQRPARKIRVAAYRLERPMKPSTCSNVASAAQSPLQVIVSWSSPLAVALLWLGAFALAADSPAGKDDFELKGTEWARGNAIINPPVKAAEDGSKIVDPSELVLGIQVGKEARAYPIKFIYGRWNEVINDRLGRQPIVASY